ncbi:cohesin domain-containing protein [Ruminococcus sp. Marseille-P6503]|uniref:cohesin domain-containing protein n=1 Tax=Ruminococcus sp. Marseille-P6503 TaxID=2364796 RepID=UPI000F520164|nr:cohesin domain-containing protein [Ruminococcus sp. Marseille-P6503]
MKLKVNKLALSLAAAVLIATSLLSPATSASADNEITLTADKTSAKEGERLNVTVGFIPNETGAAGFTVNLHYDPNKVEVYIPAETDSAYKADSKFSVVTDYAYSKGIVRIIGANLVNSNITSATDLALATFTVKSGANGKISFWTEVENMVSSSGSGYISSAYSAPTEASPLTVSISDSAASGSDNTELSSREEAGKPSASERTTAKTVSDTDSEASTPESKTVTSADPSDSKVLQTDDACPVFTYETQDSDFNSEKPVGCSFSLSDYITDFSKLYSIKVNISTSGSVNGGIGMLVNGRWQSYGNMTHRSGSDTWTSGCIDPNSVSGDIFVQLYFLKENSEFSVEAIEAVPINSSESANETDASSDSDNSGSDFEHGTETESAVSADRESQAVENAALSAAQEAEKNSDISSPDVNPSTGIKSRPLRIIVTLVCTAEILWSLFVVIYNRINEKEQD